MPKIKDILYRNFNSLSNNEKKFYEENRDKYELNLCDATNTIHYSNELIWDTDGYDAICREEYEILKRKEIQNA